MIFLIAFLAGFIVDLWQGNLLGLSSFLFLLFVFVFQLYGRKFIVYPAWFVFIYLFLTGLVYFRLSAGLWKIEGALILGVAAVIFRPLFIYFSTKGGRKLKVGL